MKKSCLVVIVFFTLLNTAFTGPSEEKVKQAVQKINADVEKINSLAQEGKLDESLEILNKLNSFIQTEITWGNVSYDMQLKAKEENPNFSYTLKIQLPEQLTNSFYEKRIALCKKHMKLVDDTKEGLQAMKDLNNMDKLYAYLQMAKKSYDAAKDMMEDYSTGNVPKAVYDLYNHSKELYEGVKQIYETYKDEKDIGAFRESVRMVVERAEKSKKKNEYLVWKLNLWKKDIDEYYSNMNNIRKIKSQVDNKPYKEMSFADNDYNWNYGPFQKEVEELCKDFEEYESSCEAFEKAFNEIKNRAKVDWGKIGTNITNSKDEKNKDRFLKDHNERWTEFEKEVVDPMFKKVYDKYCGVKKEEKEDKTEKPKEQPKKEEKKDEEKDEQEVVPDYNGLFAGSKVNKGITIVEPEREPEKTEPKKTKISSKPSYGKYWEKTLPSNTETDWYGYSSAIAVKHMLNGRTICYQSYYDPDLKFMQYECFHDNFAMQHGPYRRFAKDKVTQQVYLDLTGYYRMDKSVGPWVSYNMDGSISSVDYYIDGEKVDILEYKNRLRVDNTLPPVDCYKNYDWLTVKPIEVDDKPEIITINDFLEYGLNFPDRLGIIRTVKEQGLKGAGTPNEHIYYAEHIYSKNGVFQELGSWYWYLKPDGMQAHIHMMKFGNLTVRRNGYNKDGSVRTLRFLICDNDLMGTGNIYNNVKFFDIGPNCKNEEGKITVKYYDGRDNEISKAQYTKMYEANKFLPHPDIYTQSGAFTYPKYKKYDIFEKTSLNSDLVEFGRRDEIWKGSINHKNGEFRIDMFRDHRNAGSISWWDWDRTQIKSAYFFKGFYSASKSWYKNGSMQSFYVRPAIGQQFVLRWNDDGSIKSATERWKDHEIYKKYLQEHEYPEVSGSIISSIPDFEIPKEEMTPLFEAFIKGLKNPNTPNLNQMLSEGIKNDNSSSSLQTQKEEENDDDNYQQLQRQEFFTLGAEVQKIIEKADQSFNKKYWEDSNSSRVTMNRTNPKQEALDVLRTAIPLVKRAKYRENEAALNHLLAMKFTSYSGRVFGYEAKQDFFKEAAQLIVRADQLIPQIKHLKTKEDISEMYCTSAEVWREMTRKALWGNHEFNKMACDKKVIQQYERAVQTDPNNQMARRILEKLKAPKKPVPEVAQKFEKIPDDSWNEAQQKMLRLQAEEDFKEATKEPEKNYTEVATMTLKIGSGTVHIMYAGTSEWEKITDQHIAIYVGDKIKTSADAEGVSVTYAIDNTFLAIKPDSEVEFDFSHLMIRRGNTYIQVTKKGNKFLVITPTCAVGVRGTEFEVKVGSDKSTETYLYEGVVEARNGSDIAYLTPGQKLDVAKGSVQLETESFDPGIRKSTVWKNTDRDEMEHLQIKSQVPKVDKHQEYTSNSSTSKPGGLFSGRSSGNQGKSESSSKTPSSEQNTSTDRVITRPVVQDISICSSPDKDYHSVLVSSVIDYGTAYLVARCPVDVKTQKPLVVNWYLNNNSQAISVGNYQVFTQTKFFDAAIVSYDSPLNPGKYRVEFILDGYKIGRGSVTIKSPEKLSLQSAQQYYVGSLQMMESALEYLNQGDFSRASQMTNSSLSGLRKAVYNSPSLPDILAVMQTAYAVLALEQVDQYVKASDKAKASEWIKIANSHINVANERCQDQEFKQTILKLKNVIEQIHSEIK